MNAVPPDLRGGAPGASPARRVHPPGVLQGKRCFQHDYRAPWFYLITMTTLNRRPFFGNWEGDRLVVTRDGWLAHDLWRDIPKTYPQIETSTFVTMPDHIHGILRVRERMEKPVGVPLRAYKSLVTSALRKRHGDPALDVWNPGYHDWCVRRPGSLKAFSAYIRDNPRRAALKRAHPDLFVRVNGLSHRRLPADTAWSGYGNLFLLDRPALVPLRVSRRATPEEVEAVALDLDREAADGAVVISPFISPGEKAVAERIMAAERGTMILMAPTGLARTFKPRGRFFDLCAQGRLLILSGFPPPAAQAEPLTRETCLRMNAGVMPSPTRPTKTPSGGRRGYDSVSFKAAEVHFRLRTARVEGLGNDLPYVGLESIESQTGRLARCEKDAAKDASAAMAGESLCNTFERDDVLFGKLRPYLAKTWVAESSGRCTTELPVLKPVDLDPRYLRAICLSPGFVDKVNASTFGSKMPRADWDFIGNQPVPVPPLPSRYSAPLPTTSTRRQGELTG